MTKRVALYARISVSKEESVSVARQLDAGRKLAEARGWEVVLVEKDDGVSASKSRPEDRDGWGRILHSDEPYDAVVIWKLDRLARRTIDFLHADGALQARRRPAAVVSVEESIDMTTPIGRVVATILAAFAELEASSISARVSAAKSYLAEVGRWPGGTAPYGWHAVQREGLPGWYLEKDPRTTEYVEGAARLVLSGASVYSAKQWLEAQGAPLPEASQGTRVRTGWSYRTVERVLRSPLLAGMTRKGDDVVRGADGRPRVDESLAVLTEGERRLLLALLDDKTDPRRQPRSSSVTTPFLAGVAVCDDCEKTMTRGTTSKRPALICTACHMTISRVQLEEHLVARLLDERGDEPVIEVTREAPSIDEAALADVEAEIQGATDAMREDDADVAALAERLVALKKARTKIKSMPSNSPDDFPWTFSGQTVKEAWAAAGDNHLARRQVLVGQLDGDRFRIRRGKVGRYLDTSRVVIAWNEGFPAMA
ncbi:recombinase family protein [Janibacter melonis]|uniref:Recombinase family protein n=1 Tax=Janibacter melonis TaxID=262209 RepID=A0A5P8FKL6_9MICO|nr:recombinase family protein [Janibacter melonis]QFQ29733.2 recombinase family protein [Janibacter melonis]